MMTHSNKLNKLTRVFSLVCSLMLVAVLFFPMWRIELTAPQYPEGLVLLIWPDKLGGDVEIVNGLNHYIGMRHLHTEDFPEFSILPIIIIALALFGIITFFVNRKKLYGSWVLSIVVISIIAMIDFYKWEYEYGHELNPDAPIQVPGMAYQPPLIGYKKLLNFGAYSIPDTGGWLFIAAAVILVALWFINRFHKTKS